VLGYASNSGFSALSDKTEGSKRYCCGRLLVILEFHLPSNLSRGGASLQGAPNIPGHLINRFVLQLLC